jgi:uncharacterized protein (UPF0548 family)
VAKEAPGRVEQVQVGQGRQRVRQAVHDEPGGQEVRVEGLAVEADEEPTLPEQGRQSRRVARSSA